MFTATRTRTSITIILPLFLCFAASTGGFGATGSRSPPEKRSVPTYPPSSVLQLTMGISLAGQVEGNAAGILLAFQQNAQLPNNYTGIFFHSPLEVISARRFSLFDYLRTALDSHGYDGVECLQKMICQVAETPLSGGFLEDIFTLALSPSRHFNASEFYWSSENSLLRAETFGRFGGNCTHKYSTCHKTPLDFISQLVHH